MGYSPALPTMSAIGYRECVAVLEGKMEVEMAKQLIGRATRVFVRRQANWFKESDPTISWFRVEEGVIKKMEAFIRQTLSAHANAYRWSNK